MKQLKLSIVSLMVLAVAFVLTTSAPVFAHNGEHHGELETEHVATSAEHSKKVCNARKQGLTQRADRLVSNSNRLQSRIDGILQKAIDYKTSHTTVVPEGDWDSLIAAAQDAKVNSQDSIAKLETQRQTIDCNSTTVANDVAEFKFDAGETRDNLKAYRDSVKAVLKSLKNAQSTITNNQGASNEKAQ